MKRILTRLSLVILLSVATAAAVALSRSTDPLYSVQEWLNYSRFRRFDPIILAAGQKHGVDPMLIKAVIWRESSFHSGMIGKKGERGLMQVTEAAANDWARAQKIQDFVPVDLLSPKTNIDAGTWYLKQALSHWSQKDDPIPFALAEFNAGHRSVDRWIESTNMGDHATADDLRTSISFPSTRSYIESIMERHQFYKNRGRL